MDERPISDAETKALFGDLAGADTLVLAVSGGPDSTALMLLAARWRASLSAGPKLLAVTIDHRLRRESAREANDVEKLARKLGVSHRILRWTGAKPRAGLQAAARAERYRLLADAARSIGAKHVLTAHTRDDQAETVMIRLIRGSGLSGLAAMARVSPWPASGAGDLSLVRSLLDVPKSRLLATLKSARVGFADDPSNRNPDFTRVRIRGLLPALAQEGLSAARLLLLARRLARANAGIEHAVDAAYHDLLRIVAPGPLEFDAGKFRKLPAEIALRILGRAISERGDEGPVELGKLESLLDALYAAPSGNLRPKCASSVWRRTLAGALVTVDGNRLLVDRAPPRRRKTGRPRPLTKHKGGRIKVSRRR